MNEEILSLSLTKSPQIPTKYFEEQRKYREQELAIKLFERLVDEEWYTVKVHRDSSYTTEFVPYPYAPMETFKTEVFVGKVKPLQMKYKPQPHLNLKDRLKVLFTGHYPVGIGWE